MQKNNGKKIIVLGAGITGLSTAWRLSGQGFEVTVLDCSDKTGGLCSSFKYDGFLLDYGPHKIYTQLPQVLNEIKKLLGEAIYSHRKKSSIYLQDKFFSYPFKMTELVFGLKPSTAINCIVDYLAHSLKKICGKKKIRSYEDYVIDKFGRKLYSLVFEPLATKIWGEPKSTSYKLAQMRIPMPNLVQLMLGLLFGKNKNASGIDAKTFYYPKNGIKKLPEKMRDEILRNNGTILLNSNPVSIIWNKNRIDSIILTEKGIEREERLDCLISTIPINRAVQLFNPKLAEDAVEAARQLKFRGLVLIYIILNKSRLLKEHWVFFPESRFLFNRLFEQKTFNEDMGPKDKTVICLDLTYNKGGLIEQMSEKELCQKAIRQLEEIGLISSQDVLESFAFKKEDIYPVYDLNYEKNLNALLEMEFCIKNFFFLGRLGLFNYNNMDHCIDMGIKVADFLAGDGRKEDWREISKEFAKYRIVD